MNKLSEQNQLKKTAGSVSPAERCVMLRLWKLKNMSIDELYTLNDKLIGKGHNWLTSERVEVCNVLAEKLHLWFNKAT